MLTRLIAGLVDACCRHAWPVVLAYVVLSIGATDYARRHFAINTDSSQLISPRLEWRQREIAFQKAFAQRRNLIVVVVDGATADIADTAAARLAEALMQDASRFQFVRRPDASPFLAQNGLLFLPPEELSDRLEVLVAAQPFLGSIAADPTLRGLARTLGFLPRASAEGRIEPQDMQRQMRMLGDALETILAGGEPRIDWSELMSGRKADPHNLRRFLHVKPVLDFSALQPGAAASAAIRSTAAGLNLDSPHGVTIRLTGPVAIADEEFGTLAEGAELNTALTILSVLVLTWMALHSARIIAAVFLSLMVGLVTTAAVGLWMVDELNLISVAFAVLFIGIGVDFGIQFGVRYRTERHALGELIPALQAAAREAGKPLALAATAAAAGFYSFLPTDYRGLSELGLIAGTGMLIAFAISITLLPALLRIFRPPGEAVEIGYRWLVPVDRWLAAHRMPILIVTGLVVAAGLPLLAKVTFDFNPFHLRSPRVESVATYLDLLRDPATAGNNIEVLSPPGEPAAALAARLRGLPEVAAVTSLQTFVPDRQEEKLQLIGDAARLLGPTLQPPQVRPMPTDAERSAALNAAAESFARFQPQDAALRQEAQRLAGLLRRLATASPQVIARAELALLPGLMRTIGNVRNLLRAAPVTLENLPPELVRDWRTADGRWRLEVVSREDANDNAVLRRFARAVLAVAPEAAGPPVLIQQSADTIVAAFMQAGAVALVSITLLLFVVLRRVRDVFYTLTPLVLAGVVTLELSVLLDLKLNFANIIALPLLLGVGVAFKIYYVLAWNAGEAHPLASGLTRAVIFSAMTTATAFGSLWLSSHPGTSSMGKLLMLSLITTLVAAVVFQPILMGPPRIRPASRDDPAEPPATR